MQRFLRVGLEGVKGKVVHHHFRGVSVKTLLFSFSSSRRVISTREGLREVKAVGNNGSPPELWDMSPEEWEVYLDGISRDLGYRREDVAFLTTGADVDKFGVGEGDFEEFRVVSFATAGVASNAVRVGKDEASTYEEGGRSHNLGTVNIVLLTDANLSDGALAESIITVTEAKVRAFQDLDIRSSYNPMENQATGTGTDNVVVVSGGGSLVSYVGGHSKIGELMAEASYESVKEAVGRQNGIFLGRPMEERLRERGISLDELVEAGMEMYVPDPEVGGKKKVGSRLKEEMARALKDVNVASLILAGMKLEDDGDSVPGLRGEYRNDPVQLIADEILGIQIATYIAGSRALFEFERIDRRKPGILGKLPPFLDDVLGGLIAGCLVKVCSK